MTNFQRRSRGNLQYSLLQPSRDTCQLDIVDTQRRSSIRQRRTTKYILIGPWRRKSLCLLGSLCNSTRQQLSRFLQHNPRKLKLMSRQQRMMKCLQHIECNLSNLLSMSTCQRCN